MKLNRTDGMNSRTRKLDDKTVEKIRKLFAKGKRGQATAKKFGISPARFNQIGRGYGWGGKQYARDVLHLGTRVFDTRVHNDQNHSTRLAGHQWL